MTQAEFQRQYERLLTTLEPRPQDYEERYTDESDGRVKCGGGYRRLLVAGNGAD